MQVLPLSEHDTICRKMMFQVELHFLGNETDVFKSYSGAFFAFCLFDITVVSKPAASNSHINRQFNEGLDCLTLLLL